MRNTFTLQSCNLIIAFLSSLSHLHTNVAIFPPGLYAASLQLQVKQDDKADVVSLKSSTILSKKYYVILVDYCPFKQCYNAVANSSQLFKD